MCLELQWLYIIMQKILLVLYKVHIISNKQVPRISVDLGTTFESNNEICGMSLQLISSRVRCFYIRVVHSPLILGLFLVGIGLNLLTGMSFDPGKPPTWKNQNVQQRHCKIKCYKVYLYLHGNRNIEVCLFFACMHTSRSLCLC